MTEPQSNWQERIRQHRMQEDSGEDSANTRRRNKFEHFVSDFMYHPYTELVVFFLITLSISLLLIELSMPLTDTDGWMGSLMSGGKNHHIFITTDFVLTIIFIVEYVTKLLVAGNRFHYIRTTWIDLLAILPIFRVFRLVRTLRFLKMLRLIRAMRMETVLDNQVVQDKTNFSLQGETAVIFTYLLFSIIFGAVGVLVFERGAGSGFNHLGDGLWWCLVTITTVGYGDISPKTVGGQFVAVVIMFIGLSFYALLTGTISTILIERAQKHGEKTMEIKMLENHIIICGWNEDAGNLVDNLLETSKRHILVITDEKPVLPRSHRVYYLDRDPSNKLSLIEAKIERAFSAIILGSNKSNKDAQDVDARSILIALAVEICNPKVHSVVELQNPENEHHAKNAGVDEIIVTSTYQGSILAQSASSPGVSKVFSELFGLTSTSIHQEKINDILIGKKYAEVVQWYTTEEIGAILGIIRDEVPMLAPKASLELQDNDLLVVLTKTKL